MAAGADEQYASAEPAAAPGERGQGHPPAFVVARFLDQPEGAPGAGVMIVGRPPQRLIAKAAALELGLQPRPKRRAVAGEAGILLVNPEQQPAAVLMPRHLAKDERRETDPAFLVERAERVPAENVCDFHHPVRPPQRVTRTGRSLVLGGA